MVNIDEMYASNHGFSIRGEEPEFDDSGELTGYSVQESEPGEELEPLSVREFNSLLAGFGFPVLDKFEQANDREVRLRAEILHEVLEAEGLGSSISARQVRQLAVRGDLGGAGCWTNRWYLIEREPVIHDAVTASDTGRRIDEDVPDDLQEKMDKPYLGNLSEKGSDEKRYLMRKAAERCERTLKILSWLARQTDKNIIRRAFKLWQGEAKRRMERAKRVHCFHNIYFTKDQYKLVREAVERRMGWKQEERRKARQLAALKASAEGVDPSIGKPGWHKAFGFTYLPKVKPDGTSGAYFRRNPRLRSY